MASWDGSDDFKLMSKECTAYRTDQLQKPTVAFFRRYRLSPAPFHKKLR